MSDKPVPMHALAADVLTPVTIRHGKWTKPRDARTPMATAHDVDSLTLAIVEDPDALDSFIVDATGQLLATALTVDEHRVGWSITHAGAERISAESRTLLSFARPS